jgi:hypothetical protein
MRSSSPAFSVKSNGLPLIGCVRLKSLPAFDSECTLCTVTSSFVTWSI